MYPKFQMVIFTIILMLNQIKDSIEISEGRSNFSYGFSDRLPIPLKGFRLQNTKSSQNCIIPNSPLHTQYEVSGEFGESFNPGNSVNNFKVLRITCDVGYKISPILPKYSICVNGTWNPSPSSCLRACPSLASTISTKVQCKYNKTALENCSNPVEGTIALISCNVWFEEASIDKYPVRLCSDGKWDFSIPQCYPACGLKRHRGISSIIQGQDIKGGDYPWHIGIYNSKKELQCSGSLIDQHAVLSDAHCFANPDGSFKPAADFFLAAGKYYRKYNDDRDKLAQYSKILKIYLPESHKGRTNFYTFDIAILILTDPFVLSIAVQPVCIDLKEESSYLHFSLSTSGTITGWGYRAEIENELSDELKEVSVYYESLDKCFEEVPEHFLRFIVPDKICGRYKDNGTLVCGGNIGGGLAFRSRVTNRYYLKGVVSPSPSSDTQTCIPNQYGIYTLVSRHVVFVRESILYNRVHQPIECENDCINKETEYSSSLEIITPICRLSNFPLNASNDCCSQSTHSETVSDDECGLFSTPSIQPSIIVNGSTFEKGLFPWMVSIRHMFNNGHSEFICSGSLVSNNYVITAAHCIRQETPLYAVESLLVVLGNTDIEAWHTDYIVSQVGSVSIHPDYDFASGYSDVALFTLVTEVTFTNFIRPICIWNEDSDVNLIIGCTGTAAGWCATEGRETVIPEAINFEIPVVSKVPCPLSHGNLKEIGSSRSFCAGNGDRQKFCAKNSGAGFGMLRNGRWTLRGVASIPPKDATMCDVDNYFTFSDLAQVQDWLDKVLI